MKCLIKLLKTTILLVTIFALFFTNPLLFACDEHASYWECDSCNIDPENRINVTGGLTINWEGDCEFIEYEWWEMLEDYVPGDTLNELDSDVENNWTGSGTLAEHGTHDSECYQTVPTVEIMGCGSILYFPEAHDVEGEASDGFTITILGDQ